MTEVDTIRFIDRGKLDVSRYNSCIDSASNGLIYAYTFYLDFTAHTWGALVLNDYQAVMPLPYRKKLGICYLYQPLLTAQLGVFGKEITEQMVHAFLSSVPSYFKLWEFPLNYAIVSRYLILIFFKGSIMCWTFLRDMRCCIKITGKMHSAISGNLFSMDV